jgi:dolichol-phosphate mannosyltransferase
MSFHTMSAIRGHRLPLRQRAALAVQSRLHSKSGRTVGRRLGSMNIPIMSINSVVQWLIPPPKYHIDALLDCELVERAPIGHVFIMERGESMQRRVRPASAVPTLIENTDDAYGFPPFATFAPRLRIGDDDYASLRAKEELLLRRAIAGAAVWRVRVPGHEWAEVLPELISQNGHTPSTWEPSEKITHLRPIPVVTTVEAEDPVPVEQVSV